MKRTILVRAWWDEDAKVWVAESADVQGLVTEADTLEQLRDKVLVMIPELLELNAHDELDTALPEIPVHIMAEHCAWVANPRFS
jgi:predicted RNase H-like HicB family nuclease